MTQRMMERDFSTSAASKAGQSGPVYGEALLALGEVDPRIFCLSGDLTPATEANLFRDRLPDRFMNFGIAEANMIGAAAGIARSGGVPIVHSFSVFLTRRCFDQVAMQMAYPKTNVKLAGFLPGLTTPLGVSHQAIDDLALMRALPNMVIVEPADADELRATLDAAVRIDGPVYMRMRRTDLQSVSSGKPREFEIGKGQLLRDGGDAVIFASGVMVAVALAASEELAKRGVSVAVANIHTLKPLDTEFVSDLIASRRVVITAENHSIIGGLGSAISELVAASATDAVVERVGIQDVFGEGASTAYLFEKHGLSVDGILAAFAHAVQKASGRRA